MITDHLKQVIKTRTGILINLLREGSFIKASNFLLANYCMLTKPDIALNKPTILVFEPGNICNLFCALCVTGQRKPGRTRMKLTFTNYQKIIDEIGRYLIQLDLYNWGEPLLNPDIYKMIAYAKKYKIKVDISSNFNFYNPKIGQNLINSGLNTLILSIHGASAKTYTRYMLGGNFRKVTNNIKSFVALRKSLGSTKPILRWRFVVFKHNQHEILKAMMLAKKIGVDEFEAIPMKINVGDNPEETIKSIPTKMDWAPTLKKYNIYQLKKKLNITSGCVWPWEITSIAADGGVQPCCVFYDQKHDFGNAFRNSFASVWNNKKYQTARRVLREKMMDNKQIICGQCQAGGFIGK